jgi:hypothetical protein
VNADAGADAGVDAGADAGADADAEAESDDTESDDADYLSLRIFKDGTKEPESIKSGMMIWLTFFAEQMRKLFPVGHSQYYSTT